MYIFDTHIYLLLKVRQKYPTRIFNISRFLSHGWNKKIRKITEILPCRIKKNG